jgi:hypothetical protein
MADVAAIAIVNSPIGSRLRTSVPRSITIRSRLRLRPPSPRGRGDRRAMSHSKVELILRQLQICLHEISGPRLAGRDSLYMAIRAGNGMNIMLAVGLGIGRIHLFNIEPAVRQPRVTIGA